MAEYLMLFQIQIYVTHQMIYLRILAFDSMANS